MKIIDVSLTLFTWDDIPATSYGAHRGKFSGSSQLGLLALRTDEGLTGHSFLGAASNGADIDGLGLIRYLKPIVMGQDPLDRERLNESMWRRGRPTTTRAIGAMDIALWDIAGQAAGMPLHRLMGSYRDRIGAYASSQVLPDAGAYVDDALHFKAAGWHAYKIHPPQSWREDISICEAVRNAVGFDYKLMLDSTWAYKYETALRVGLAIQDMDYYWFEDPLADQDLHGYVRLKQKLNIPLMATEYPATGLDSYQPWITQKATDFLRGDVAVKGGITTMLKTAHLAEAFHMNYEIHHGGNSINNLANLHVAMAIRNTELFEVLLPSAAQNYGLLKDIEIDAKGYVHAPNAPGLGALIDYELIKRKKVAVLV